MKQLYRCLLPGCLLGAGVARAQAPTLTPTPPPARVTISGYVRDQATGENLIGVAVVQAGTGQGTATNTYGFYSLTLPTAGLDSVRLVANYVGYERQRWAVPATGSARHDFRLPAATNELAGVEVVGDRQAAADDHGPRSTRMGTINVPIAQIKSLPKFMGETDVLKVLQLLPGVQSGGEGTSGLYVRGGSPDQNLILLDGTPVYNAAHLFGFFSVFNADALNNVELIKGGFPARYGGRLSSVLDISMKEGNAQQLHGEGAISLVASRLTLEGPIKKDVASFIISARRTYIDVVARPFIQAQLKREQQAGSVGYYFYDLNAKLNWKVSPHDRLYLSAYRGYDNFYANLHDADEASTDFRRSDSQLGWGNLTSALRWNHVVNDRLFANTHLTYSQYQFDIGEGNERRYLSQGQPTTSTSALSYLSSIKDFTFKTDFDYLPSPDHYLRFGGQLIRHAFRPGAVVQHGNTDNLASASASGSRTAGTESAVYVEDDYRLSARLKVNAGLRLSSFYVENKLYPSLEPRLAARYMLTDEWALKGSYARTTQYVHLLTNSGIGLPTDLWVPATAAVRPQVAHQFSLGAARTLRHGGEEFEFSFETYYKPMQNLVEYREGASFLNTTDGDWQSKITSGRGWAYGGELFLQKKTGRTTGWLGYTLAWSNRQFSELNQGRVFPYKYDRRHDISLVVIHHFSPSVTLSGTWVYGTGNATTLASGRYQLGTGQIFDDYGDRNSFRMAAYHRFDLDLSKTKKKRWGEVVNSLSIYNVYSRQNPYYLYFDAAYVDSQGVVQKPATYRQVSLFPIIPSVSKAFKF
ncbi:TonB-dependent receptor [Hymenobacter arcticus]